MRLQVIRPRVDNTHMYLLVILVLFVAVWFLPVVVISLRGRTTLGFLAVFLPVIGLLLMSKVMREPAKPSSIWAERFYGEHMMEVARRRYPMTAIFSGTYSENKQAVAEHKVRKRSRKARRRAAKVRNKAARRESLRATSQVAEAKASDWVASGRRSLLRRRDRDSTLDWTKWSRRSDPETIAAQRLDGSGPDPDDGGIHA